MNRIVLIIALSIMPFCLFAQNEQMKSLIYPQISKDSTIIGYNEIDGKKYEVIQIHRWNVDEKRIRIDGKITDSLLFNKYDGNVPFCYNGNVFWGLNSAGKTLSYYTIQDGKFEESKVKFYHDDLQKRAFMIDSSETKLFVVDPFSGKQSLMYDFCQSDENLYTIEDGLYNKYISAYYVCFLSENVVILALLDSYFSDNAVVDYYLISNGEKKKVTNYIDHDQSGYVFNINIDYYDKEYIKLSYVSYEEYYRIYSHDFSIKYNVLGPYRGKKCGLNYSDGKMQFYYQISSLDDADYDSRPINYGTKVIIPYKFNPQLEIQMYRAYNDTLLSEADIEGLGKYELGILRNLMFAKHNYAFKSEFYQAYFNMYEFYNSQKMRTTRKTNVDNELTANDKANIALIREMEAKLK